MFIFSKEFKKGKIDGNLNFLKNIQFLLNGVLILLKQIFYFFSNQMEKLMNKKLVEEKKSTYFNINIYLFQLTTPGDEAFANCTSSSFIEGYSCENGLSGEFKDEPYKMWVK